MSSILKANPINFSYYYNLDFKFMANYFEEFGADLHVKVIDRLEIYLKDWHIASIALAAGYRRVRSYKVTFHPEFVSLPSIQNGEVVSENEEVYNNLRIELGRICSVTVEPGLIHFWCHKLLWDAYEVIAYKKFN